MPAPYFVDEVRLGLLEGDDNASWQRRDSSLSTVPSFVDGKESYAADATFSLSIRSSLSNSDTSSPCHCLPQHYGRASHVILSQCPRSISRRNVRRAVLLLVILVLTSLSICGWLATQSTASRSFDDAEHALSDDVNIVTPSVISLFDSDPQQNAAASVSPPGSPIRMPFELHHSEEISTGVSVPSLSARNRRLLYDIPSQAPLFASEACLELWISSGAVCDQLSDVYTVTPELKAIDILYSWVNGSDWRHSSAKWMHAYRPSGRWQEYVEEDLFPTSTTVQTIRAELALHDTVSAPQATTSKSDSALQKRDTSIDSRFRDHEELRYAMRSATKHLQGLKTMHVVAPDYSAPYHVQPQAQQRNRSRRSLPFTLSAEGLAKAFRGLPSQLRRAQNLAVDRFTTQDGQVREGQVPQWLTTSTDSRVLVGESAESSPALASPMSAGPEVRLHHDWNSFKDNWLSTAPVSKVEVQRLTDYRRLALPTFNSMAVESMLGDEPGLAENFIYANDDFFFLDDASVSDIISPLYGPVFRIDPHLTVEGEQSPDPAVGEWPALKHTNWLLNQRFGTRARPYTIHVQKSFSKSLLMETRMTWAAEHARLGLTRFRTGGDNIVTHFLAYYNTIERHREALLWTFFILRLDQDGDGWASSTEWRSSLVQMGLPEDQVEIVMNPSRRVAVQDLRVSVKLPRRRTLAKEEVNGALVKTGWPVPLNTRYVFSSQDGYPIADMSDEVIISSDTQTGRPSGRLSKRSEALIADWPDFVDEPSHHIWADSRFNRVACELDLGRCLQSPFPAPNGNTSWEAVFKHFAFQQPQCGDCLIHHLLAQSGEKGFEAFLPSAERIAMDGARATRDDGLRRVPHLPLATAWDRTGPAQDGELEASCFSISCVLGNSGYGAGSSLRQFGAKLIQRYSYVIGNSPVQFRQLETSRNADKIFDSLDRSSEQPSALETFEHLAAGTNLSSTPTAWLESQAHINAKRPVFVCINDDIRESWVKTVGDQFTSWLSRTWPYKQPWEY